MMPCAGEFTRAIQPVGARGRGSGRKDDALRLKRAVVANAPRYRLLVCDSSERNGPAGSVDEGPAGPMLICRMSVDGSHGCRSRCVEPDAPTGADES